MDEEKITLSQLRNEVIDKLQHHYAHGNLEEEEFEELLDRAINAGDKSALVPINRMLAPVPASERSAETIRRRDQGRLVTIFGGTERKGEWLIPRRLEILNVFGGTELNLTQCPLGGEETEINLFCVMGGVEIIVPDNASVAVEGIPIFGGFEDSSRGDVPGGPRIRITGLVIFGGVEIRPMNRRERRRIKNSSS